MAEKIDRKYLEQIGNIEVVAQQVVEGFITGFHKSPFHGFSVEFAEHRLYNLGESTRHIDWKLYARTDKLFTKKYEEETNLRCQFVLDTSSSMYFQSEDNWSKIKYSIYAIASLIKLLKKQRDAVGLSIFNENLLLHTGNKTSNKHQQYLYAQLEKYLHQYDKEILKTSKGNIQALHDIAERCHKRSLIVIFTDLLDNPENKDDFFDALQHLKHNKHEVLIFHVADHKKEIAFQLENRPYTLIDMETGEQMKLLPNQIKENYASRMQKYLSEIKEKCGQYRIGFQELDTNSDLRETLIQFLIKRQKMTL